jgi:hypothetical protein
MAKFCIDRPVAEKLKEAVKTGEIAVARLYEMDSAQRRSTFEKYVSTDLAQFINTNFEKAMVSKQKDALTNWAKGTFKPEKSKARNYDHVLKKIEQLDKMGVLSPESEKAFLSDLIADKLGISLNPAEIKTITEKATKLESLFQTKTGDGLPPIEYWVERRNMEKYLNSLSPTHKLKVATSIIGRGNMLLAAKSALTNIESNTVNGFVQGLERRIASGSYTGLNGDFAVSYVKRVNQIYQKSGFDISRMENIMQGQRRLGEDFVTSSEGPGWTRAIGRWHEDIVFKQLMGAPDVAASSVAFADSANLASSKIARGEGLTGQAAKARALRIFKDAVKIEPDTVEGEMVRSQAIADSTYATYTNNGFYSDLAMAIRTTLNKASGDIRLGDQLMPFVKTPANVVQAGLDAAGAGAIRGFWKLPEAIRQLKIDNPQPMRDVVRNFVRSGLGLTLATALAFMFDPDDFVGEYESLDPKNRTMTGLKNAGYNSIRIGDKYISLDYFGPLAAPFVGIMYARKYGDNLPEKIYQYGRGTGGQVLKVPGLREFSDLIGEISEEVQRNDPKKTASVLTDQFIGFIRGRAIPAIVNDFAQGIDPYQRQTGGKAVSKLQSSIPVAREALPAKVNQVTGEAMKSEGIVSTILFGSRLKTANTDKLVGEIVRLNDAGFGPAIAEVQRSSTRIKGISEQLGPAKTQEMLEYYGKRFSRAMAFRIGSENYKAKSDADKQELINKVRGLVMNETFKKFYAQLPQESKKAYQLAKR